MVRAALLILAALAMAGCDRMDVGRAVKAELRDPDSARFEMVHRCGRSNVYSGFVNAKNAYGGYAGNELFYYKGGIAWVSGGADDAGFTAAHEECMTAMEAALPRISAGAAAAMNSASPSPAR